MLKLFTSPPPSSKNRIVKILLLNILLFTFFVFILNFVVYYFDIINDDYFNKNKIETIKSYISFMKRDISENNTYRNLIENSEYRPIENIESQKDSIVLFGCSFTWGTGLNDNETFSYQLGKLTNRPIFNRAMGGWGVQHMLYQLRNKDFYKHIISENKKNPEYIIYTFISSHKSRIYIPVCYFYNPCYLAFYKKDKKTNDFILKNRNFFTDKIIFYYPILEKIFKILEGKYCEKIDEIVFDYFIACKRQQKINLPNTKFVIIFYDQNAFLSESCMKKLEEAGFILITKNDFQIDTDDIAYRLPDTHPNALAWEKITPAIVDKLQLNE